VKQSVELIDNRNNKKGCRSHRGYVEVSPFFQVFKISKNINLKIDLSILSLLQNT
jgi:hypothetical protein